MFYGNIYFVLDLNIVENLLEFSHTVHFLYVLLICFDFKDEKKNQPGQKT